MKNARLVAERYAEALSGAVPSEDDLARVRGDMHRLDDLIAASADLRRALGNPVVESAQKLKVLEALAKRISAHARTVRFLTVLASHDRLDLLHEVVAAVDRVFDKRLGVVEAEIRSAAPLDETVRERLVGVLQRVAGARVRINEKIEPELLGGLVVKIGGTVYDGSVRARLHELKNRLTGETVGAL